MQDFLAKIKERAVLEPKRVLLPEFLLDERVQQAAVIASQEKLAKICLLGDDNQLKEKCTEYGLKPGIDVELISFDRKSEFAKTYADLRKHKGLTIEQAEELLVDVNHYAALLALSKTVDGVVTGSTYSTGATIKPYLQLLTEHDEFSRVSGFFFLLLNQKVYFFADCSVNIEPTAEELAGIAIDSATTALHFGLIPKLAMLSFSTHGSAHHPLIEKVKKATEIIKEKKPNLLVDGEIQVDAAMVPSVADRKAPDSPLQGDANILIFPSLEAGNIGYKLVERLAGAQAIGPILQGLISPVNDLSRGCNVLDIVNLIAITSVQAQLESNN